MSEIVTKITTLEWGLFILLLLAVGLHFRRSWAYAVLSIWALFVITNIAVLPEARAKLYDPISWATLLGALVVGVGIGWSRSAGWRWGWMLTAYAFFAFVFLQLSTLPDQNDRVLMVICYVGLLLGQWLVPGMLGRSVWHPEREARV